MDNDIRTKHIMKNLRLLKVYEDEFIPDGTLVYQRVWRYDRTTKTVRSAAWYACRVESLTLPTGQKIRTIKYTDALEFPALKTVVLDIHPFERSKLFYPLKRDDKTAYYIDKNIPEFANEL
mgnify:CR=1 FL=1